MGLNAVLGRNVIWNMLENKNLKPKLDQNIQDYFANNTEERLNTFVESFEFSPKEKKNMLIYLEGKLTKTKEKNDDIDHIEKFFHKILNNKMLSQYAKNKVRVYKLEIEQFKMEQNVLIDEFKDRFEAIEPFSSEELEKLKNEINKSPLISQELAKKLCATLDAINKKDYTFLISKGIIILTCFPKENLVGNYALAEEICNRYSAAYSDLFNAYKLKCLEISLNNSSIQWLKG